MGLREKKREATRRAIISAAEALFNNSGYDAVSVEEIAAQANVAKGTVYNYFPSKEDIAAALANASFTAGLPVVEGLLTAGTPAIDILKGLFAAGASWAEKDPRLAHVTLSHILRQVFAIGSPASEVEGFNSLYRLMHEMIEIAQEAGHLRNDLPAEEMARILAMLHAQTLWFWTSSPADSPIGSMERSLQTWLEGAAAIPQLPQDSPN